MKSNFKTQKKWIVSLIITILSNNPVFTQHVQPIDSLGNVWIVTIDKSGSMVHSRSAAKMANEISLLLSNNPYLNKIDFTKDHFLFFTSGYSWDDNIGLGNEISRAPRFDSCFIHSTDKELHSFDDNNAMVDKVKDIMAENNYFHDLSFVSQIRVFSIVKAVEFLKSRNKTKNFQHLKILNITDDADINDQWLTDYKNLKKWAPNKVEEIGNIISKYIYNSLNGDGYGNLEEIYSDEKTTPHIWLYSYTSKQSLPEKAENQKYFDISALNGKIIEINLLTKNYKDEKILFSHLDSVLFNETKYLINQNFNSYLNLDLNYENKFSKNKIKLFGSFQVQYTDSIYGEHYKKYNFSQSAILPTAYRVATIFKIKIILSALIILFLVYWLLILPNKNLFTIYSNQGKKYTIKRGYKFHWRKGTIPILSGVVNGDSISVICKKHQNLKTKSFFNYSDSKYSFIICSNRKLFSDETIQENNIVFKNSQTNIEEFYSARSGDYPELLKQIYRKTTLFRYRKNLCNSNRKWIRIIGNILVKISNRFCIKFYHVIPIKAERNLSFRHKSLQHRKFTIESKVNKIKKINDENSKFSLYCLNHYYNETQNKSYGAIIYCGLTCSHIYWNVLLPEYEKNDRASLRYVFNAYNFKQILTKETEEQITYNLKLLRKEVKKQIKNSAKIKEYKITSLENNNPHNFEITNISCSGFLYLIENTEKRHSQKLYSPFEDGLKSKKDVFVRKFKTESSHLYLSFLPPNLINGESTLMRKVSDELIKINESSDSILEIKNNKQIIFKNINSEI